MFKESKNYPILQNMLTSYFYPGDEDVEEPTDFARRLIADNPRDYLEGLQRDIKAFLFEAGPEADARFLEEFLSYFAPADGSVREWLSKLDAALSTTR
jgi:hypothetical protein